MRNCSAGGDDGGVGRKKENGKVGRGGCQLEGAKGGDHDAVMVVSVARISMTGGGHRGGIKW